MSTVKFKNISQVIQKRRIWPHTELNEDNSQVAKDAFYRDDSLVSPEFAHEKGKMLRLIRNVYALKSTIPDAIERSGCTKDEKAVLKKSLAWALKGNEYVVKVLSRFFPDPKELFEGQPEYLKQFYEIVLDKESLQAASLGYYGYQIDSGLLLSLLHDTLAVMDRNDGNWQDEDLEVAREIGTILSLHGLSKVWSPNFHCDTPIYRPDDETVRKFGDLAKLKLDRILRHLPYKEGFYSPEEVVELTNKILGMEYKDMTQYRAEVNEKGRIFSVDTGKYVAKVPRERSKGPINYATLYASWFGHEIGTHVLRAIPYEGVEMTELSVGYTCYEGMEEGIAKCVEKALLFSLGNTENQANRSAIDYYVNIGLAHFYGFNFRELWTLRRDIIYLTSLRNSSDRAQLMQRAMDNAYDQVRRVFRGTGDTVEYKDLCYYVAEERVWKLIEQHIDQPDELWFTLMGLGKVNLFDADTRSVLRIIINSKDFPWTEMRLTHMRILPGILDD